MSSSTFNLYGIRSVFMNYSETTIKSMPKIDFVVEIYLNRYVLYY